MSTISVTYPSIRTYDVELISWRQYPEGVADTLRLQNYVNVTENYWGAYPPGLMVINGVRTTCGKLGDGDLRWKETKLRPTKRPPLPAI